MDGRSCRTCGTALAPGATWCSACYRRSFEEHRGELAQELIRAFEDRARYRSEPPEPLTAPTPEPVYSRWQAGPTTFGPRVKVALTVLIGSTLVIPPAVVLSIIGLQLLTGRVPDRPVAYPFLSVMGFLAVLTGTLLLRSIWRKVRIR